MAVIQISRVVHRRGSSGELPDALADGEIGMTTDTGEVFYGAPNHPSVQGRNSYPYQNIKIITELDVQYGVKGDVYYHGALATAYCPTTNTKSSVIPLFKHGQREFATYDFSLSANNGATKVIGTLSVCVHPTEPNNSVMTVDPKAVMGWGPGDGGAVLKDKFGLSRTDPTGSDTGTTWLAFHNTLGANFTLSISGREWSSPVPAFVPPVIG